MSTPKPSEAHRAKAGTEHDRVNQVAREAAALAQQATRETLIWKLAYTHQVAEEDLPLLHATADTNALGRLAARLGTK